jgi:hypothetical protein
MIRISIRVLGDSWQARMRGIHAFVVARCLFARAALANPLSVISVRTQLLDPDALPSIMMLRTMRLTARRYFSKTRISAEPERIRYPFRDSPPREEARPVASSSTHTASPLWIAHCNHRVN